MKILIPLLILSLIFSTGCSSILQQKQAMTEIERASRACLSERLAYYERRDIDGKSFIVCK